MIFINEWLPNPPGKDDGEFIELYNNGRTEVSLNGYEIGTGAKKTFSLNGRRIAAGGYLLLPKTQTKLSLKNTDGEVLLYGPGGAAIEDDRFSGAAPEGKSWSRVSYSPLPIGHFVFTYPTPGAANRAVDMAVAVRDYPIGVALTPRITFLSAVAMATTTGAFIVLFFTYVIRKNRNLSQFFFSRDEGAGS